MKRLKSTPLSSTLHKDLRYSSAAIRLLWLSGLDCLLILQMHLQHLYLLCPLWQVTDTCTLQCADCTSLQVHKGMGQCMCDLQESAAVMHVIRVYRQQCKSTKVQMLKDLWTACIFSTPMSAGLGFLVG